MDERQRIIQEILRVSGLVAPRCLTMHVFRSHSPISRGKIRYWFGSWSRALQAAGLEANPLFGGFTGAARRLPDDELLLEIGRLWERLGRQPSADEMNALGGYSVKPYKSRWGTFPEAVSAYVGRFGEPTMCGGADATARVTSPRAGSAKPAPRSREPGGPVGRRPSVIYGEPLDFRGLRYAPVNEQGVVYLFGLVSRELGFLIESVRTSFADCQGKRRMDSTGRKWEDVAIEFEYRSSAFAEHAHDQELCDLIVCWVHDWEDSPVEVLELRSVIARLRTPDDRSPLG